MAPSDVSILVKYQGALIQSKKENLNFFVLFSCLKSTLKEEEMRNKGVLGRGQMLGNRLGSWRSGTQGYLPFEHAVSV